MDLDFDFDDTFQQQVKYALIVFLLLVPVVAAHNLSKDVGGDETTIGFCNVTLECSGPRLAGMCIGFERNKMDCMDPQADNGAAEDVNYAEVECALQAYHLCDKKDVSGTEWASQATYKNKTCQAWSDERGAGLLDCSETYPPLEYPE